MEYILHIGVMINIYILLVLSANLPIGMSNLLTMGQAAFYGVGAYISAFFLMQFNLPFIVVALVVMLLTGVFSYLVSFASIKLKGDYFVLATLGFQMIVYTVLYNWTDVTRGPYGVPGIPSITFAGVALISQMRYIMMAVAFLVAVSISVKSFSVVKEIFTWSINGMKKWKKIVLIVFGELAVLFVNAYYWFCFVAGFFVRDDSQTFGYVVFANVLVLVTTLLFKNIKYSPYGRVLRALRNDEYSVAAMGRNPVAFKSWAFFFSAAFSGLAGLIYASYVSYIDPTSFTLDESIFIISALFIGGTGNVRGPILGALFVMILPEALRFVGMPDAIAANMRQIIYGLALIVIMYFRPQGLWGETEIK